MSKITFRADDDLVEQIEGLEASKSEVMREALRAYLDEGDRSSGRDDGDGDSLDAALAARVDELVAERLDDRERARPAARPQDVNVNLTVETPSDAAVDARASDEPTGDAHRTPRTDSSPDTSRDCGQCGETLSDDHVYCPNCGEKASRRVFCDCGDEVRSDWAFCPSCGRRTPAADVLDSS